MTREDQRPLAFHPGHAPAAAAEDAAACSPKIYVSNEEASLLRQVRHLRDRAVELRRQIGDATPERRQALEAEIEELRRSREELVLRREQAYRRKMVMLGHLPPEALDEEIIL